MGWIQAGFRQGLGWIRARSGTGFGKALSRAGSEHTGPIGKHSRGPRAPLITCESPGPWAASRKAILHPTGRALCSPTRIQAARNHPLPFSLHTRGCPSQSGCSSGGKLRHRQLGRGEEAGRPRVSSPEPRAGLAPPPVPPSSPARSRYPRHPPKSPREPHSGRSNAGRGEAAPCTPQPWRPPPTRNSQSHPGTRAGD